MIHPANIKDAEANATLSENEKISTKNGTVNGKTITNGNGTANRQIIYQNGNAKSDAAVIDIIEDGKYKSNNSRICSSFLL